MDIKSIAKRLRTWHTLSPFQAAELIHLVHAYAPDAMLAAIATDASMYRAPGPRFEQGEIYGSQAVIALLGLTIRPKLEALSISEGFDLAFLQILHTFLDSKEIDLRSRYYPLAGPLERLLTKRRKVAPPHDAATLSEFARLARQLAGRLETIRNTGQPRSFGANARERLITALNSWADSLEHVITTRAIRQTKPKFMQKSRPTSRATAKKNSRKG